MNNKNECFITKHSFFLFVIKILGHYRCNILRAATLFGVLLLALAAGAGAGHFADVAEGSCTLFHGLNNLTLGNIVAVAYQFVVLHILTS